MSRVLVTHADQPLGLRIVKRLFHDPAIESLLAVGEGRAPRSFARFLAGEPPRFDYVRADLARHRAASDLFHSGRVRESGIDTVVHVPRHGAAPEPERPVVSGLPVRTAESRLVLQHCLEVPSIRHLVALGSACVYKLASGNAACVREESELDLEPSISAERRAWIDADMLFHAEVGSDRLRVVLLRLPSVVGDGGEVYLNALLEGPPRPHLRPLGFDPLLSLISDKDVARGVQHAIHVQDAEGVFNLAAEETLPLSRLASWTGRSSIPVPGWAVRALQGLGVLGDAAPRRFGITLDTTRARRELGFQPGYHIALARGGDGRPRLEATPL